MRHTGQEWLVRKFGAYLPGVYEEVSVVVTEIHTSCYKPRVRWLVG